MIGACQTILLEALQPLPTRVLSSEPRGPDAVQQLAIDGLPGGAGAEPRDVTRTVHFVSSHPLVASVDQTGLITARGDGSAKITVEAGGISATIPVTVKEFTAGVPVHFANQVVPIFTKLGCNAGGCHGKSSGQNGFKLSLLGFYPDEDYEYLVKEARGRRLSPSSPGQSLLLTKPVGRFWLGSPPGGGMIASSE